MTAPYLKIFTNSSRECKHRIALLCGSARKNSLTRANSLWIKDYLLEKSNFEILFVDPSEIPNHDFGQFFAKETAEGLQAEVGKCKGIICCTPEYHGSYSATLKLIIENLGYPSVMKGKPIALSGVAAGVIGAIKSLEHLRSVFSHLGCVVLPQATSIAKIHKVIDGDGKVLDQEAIEQNKLSIDPFIEYVKERIE